MVEVSDVASILLVSRGIIGILVQVLTSNRYCLGNDISYLVGLGL